MLVSSLSKNCNICCFIIEVYKNRISENRISITNIIVHIIGIEEWNSCFLCIAETEPILGISDHMGHTYWQSELIWQQLLEIIHALRFLYFSWFISVICNQHFLF